MRVTQQILLVEMGSLAHVDVPGKISGSEFPFEHGNHITIATTTFDRGLCEPGTYGVTEQTTD